MIESITYNNLVNLQLEHPMIPLTFDKMLKDFFEDNIDIYKMFTISVVYLNLLKEDINLEIKNTELPVSHYKEYKKTIKQIKEIEKGLK